MSFQKILVIKLRHLGDVLLSSPVFTHLQRAYPNARIDAFVWKEAKEMLEGHPSIGKIYLYDRKLKALPFFIRIKKELALLWVLRKEKYDCVIQLTEGDRGRIVALFSGAKTRVGVAPNKKHKAKMLTHLIKPCKTPKHAVERDLDAVRSLGIFPPLENRQLVFALPKGALQWAEEAGKEGPYIVLHPLARWRFKCPPPHLIAKVIDRLPYQVILTGAFSEKSYVEEIVNQAASNPLNLCGKTSLKEMGALIKRSQGLITVDSVALHMASALKVPVIALFGPTSEQNWGPWDHPQSVVIAQKRPCRPCLMDGCGGTKMSDCLWTLSPDEIAQVAKKLFTKKERDCLSTRL